MSHDIGRDHLADEILVQFVDGAGAEEIEALKDELGAETLGRTAVIGIERLRLPEGSDLDATLRALNANPIVELTDLNYRVETETAQSVSTNDALFGSQWALENTGSVTVSGNSGFEARLNDIAQNDADIDAVEAWHRSTGEGVVVAVIDTGIDLDHPDLVGNLWRNPGEIAGNGIDDDGNGYVDDVHGYDFGGTQLNVHSDSDANPDDRNGHGTHVAGIIAGEGGNGTGIAGVAPDAQIMALRVGADDSPYLSGFAILQAIEYATANGARVSNNSYGPLGAFHRPVIEAAGAAGQLFVYAAGNSGRNQDGFGPTNSIYDLDNVIAVAASSLDDTLTGFSNYGENTVDLAAPGHYIRSTYLGGDYAVSERHLDGGASRGGGRPRSPSRSRLT